MNMKDLLGSSFLCISETSVPALSWSVMLRCEKK